MPLEIDYADAMETIKNAAILIKTYNDNNVNLMEVIPDVSFSSFLIQFKSNN